MQRLILTILNIVAFAALLTLYISNADKWIEQNVLARVWATLEITTKLVEPIMSNIPLNFLPARSLNNTNEIESEPSKQI